jgi:osmotically inducible lipoprotein OsmB
MPMALKAAAFALLLVAAPIMAQAGTLEGAAIGAGTGAVVAGPPGAVVGGVIGAVVGGPDIAPRRSYRSCWRDRNGHRHCRR